MFVKALPGMALSLKMLRKALTGLETIQHFVVSKPEIYKEDADIHTHTYTHRGMQKYINAFLTLSI